MQSYNAKLKIILIPHRIVTHIRPTHFKRHWPEKLRTQRDEKSGKLHVAATVEVVALPFTDTDTATRQ